MWSLVATLFISFAVSFYNLQDSSLENPLFMSMILSVIAAGIGANWFTIYTKAGKVNVVQNVFTGKRRTLFPGTTWKEYCEVLEELIDAKRDADSFDLTVPTATPGREVTMKVTYAGAVSDGTQSALIKPEDAKIIMEGKIATLLETEFATIPDADAISSKTTIENKVEVALTSNHAPVASNTHDIELDTKIGRRVLLVTISNLKAQDKDRLNKEKTAQANEVHILVWQRLWQMGQVFDKGTMKKEPVFQDEEIIVKDPADPSKKIKQIKKKIIGWQVIGTRPARTVPATSAEMLTAINSGLFETDTTEYGKMEATVRAQVLQKNLNLGNVSGGGKKGGKGAGIILPT